MKILLRLAGLSVFAPTLTFAQGCKVPDVATYITAAELKEVQNAGAARTPPAVDQMLAIVDLCKYNLGIGIIHRGSTRVAARGGAKKGGGRGKVAAERCSSGPAPANMTPSGASGISHDDETETYIIIGGAATMVTGGVIVDGIRSGPESEVTKILNGPSCSGQIVGNVQKREVGVGDMVIIPFGTPHGFSDIPDHIDYLSVRPDPDHVLQAGYVNPAIKK